MIPDSSISAEAMDEIIAIDRKRIEKIRLSMGIQYPNEPSTSIFTCLKA